MSWAEDMGYDAYDAEDFLENQWKSGYHTTQDGTRILLSGMTLQHLINSIRYFAGYDVGPFKEEIMRRHG